MPFGNRWFDLTGSYGVNLFGYDFYKECIAEGAARAKVLGPVLGAYHPSVLFNVERLEVVHAWSFVVSSSCMSARSSVPAQPASGVPPILPMPSIPSRLPKRNSPGARCADNAPCALPSRAA